jgi:hypothetical protein
MAIADDILATLRDSSEPLSNRDIRELLDLDGTDSTQRISNALHALQARGQIERVADDERPGFRYRITGTTAKAPAAPKPSRRPPAPSTAQAPIAAAETTPTQQREPPPPKPSRRSNDKPSAPAPTQRAAGADAARVAPIAGAPTLGHLRQQLRLVASEVLLEAGDQPMPEDLERALHELIRLAA